MKRPWSPGEKWLLLAPLPLVAFAGMVLFWKQRIEPESLALPMSIVYVKSLPNEKLFVLMEPQTYRVGTFPIGAIYDLSNGSQMKSRVLKTRVNQFNSQVSPDGKLWMVRESRNSFQGDQMSLWDLSNLETIATFKGSYGRMAWIENRSLLVGLRRGDELWKIGQGNKISSQDAEPRELLPVSPNEKWVVERHRGISVEYPDYNLNGYEEKSRFEPQHHYLVSTSHREQKWKLPGDPWRALAWQKGGDELWGVSPLEGAYPQRADMLRFNTVTHETTSIPLEIPANTLNFSWDAVDFKYSPDGRVLVAGFPSRSLIVWDASTGRFLKFFSDDKKSPPRPDTEPQFSADGQKLLRLTHEGVEIYRIDQLFPRRGLLF
jgi:WD40 repeat protein